MYNFTEKQIALLNAIKALNVSQKLWAHDPIGRSKIEVAKESVQALLVYNIGTSIVLNEINKETK